MMYALPFNNRWPLNRLLLAVDAPIAHRSYLKLISFFNFTTFVIMNNTKVLLFLDFNGALFCRVLKNGKIQAGRLSDQAIYNVVKKRQKEAGITEISPHDFRKTFISTILEETGDLEWRRP